MSAIKTNPDSNWRTTAKTTRPPCRQSVLRVVCACCRAGNDVTRAISLGSSTACTKTCYSSPTGDCGGELASTVYVVGSNKPAVTSPASQGYSSLGCFKDNLADRAMPRLLKSDVRMTVDECAALAKAGGEQPSMLGLQVLCVMRSTHSTALHATLYFFLVSSAGIRIILMVLLCCCRAHIVWNTVGSVMLRR